MKRRLINYALLLCMMAALLVGFSAPESAGACDSAPKWLKGWYSGNAALYDNGYYSGVGPVLTGSFTGPSAFTSLTGVENATCGALTLRIKSYPTTYNNRIKGYHGAAFNSGTYYDSQGGATATCWEMGTGTEGYGCQLYMPANSYIVVLSPVYYQGYHPLGNPEWFSTTKELWNDTYSTQYAGMYVYTNLN